MPGVRRAARGLPETHPVAAVRAQHLFREENMTTNADMATAMDDSAAVEFEEDFM